MKTLALAVLAALAATAGLMLNSVAADLELDPSGTIAAAHRESERLDAQIARLAGRVRVRQAATADLVAGRVTLPEAIARTRRQGLGGACRVPGETEDERIGLVLVSWAVASAPERGRPEFASRLRAELRDYLGREPADWPWWRQGY